MSRETIYSPHFCAIMVVIGPACTKLRASPSFRECCVRDSTELSHAELVFKPVQVTKSFNVSVAYAQGLLERHCDDAVRGAIKVTVWTSSSLSSETGALFILVDDCHLPVVGLNHHHEMSRCILEKCLPYARVCSCLQRLQPRPHASRMAL